MSINDLEDRMMAKIVMICRDGFKNSVNILSLILHTLITQCPQLYVLIVMLPIDDNSTRVSFFRGGPGDEELVAHNFCS